MSSEDAVFFTHVSKADWFGCGVINDPAVWALEGRVGSHSVIVNFLEHGPLILRWDELKALSDQEALTMIRERRARRGAKARARRGAKGR